MLHYTRVERLDKDKIDLLLGLFVSYKVSWIWPLSLNLKHFIFLVTDKLVWQDGVLDYTRMERLAKDKRYSLLDPFVSYKEKWTVVNMIPGSTLKTLHFLGNLWKGDLSYIIILHSNWKAY